MTPVGEKTKIKTRKVRNLFLYTILLLIDESLEHFSPVLNIFGICTSVIYQNLCFYQVDALAQSVGLAIVGYYAACENFKDNSIEKAPGVKIAEKIAEIYPSALFIMVSFRNIFFKYYSFNIIFRFSVG